MLEPTLRYGLSSAALDLLVCADGGLLILHTGTGQVWHAQLLLTAAARNLEGRWLREDFEAARADWGRDPGDEHRERRAGRAGEAGGADGAD